MENQDKQTQEPSRASSSKGKKKLAVLGLLAFSLIIVLGIAGYSLFSQSQKPTYQVGVISERSKEFLKSQREDTTNTLYNTDFDGKNIRDTKQSWPVGECFEITIPAQVIDSKEQAPCSAHFFLDQPKANVVVALSEVSYTDIGENPGVKMRQENTEKYAKDVKKVGKHSFTIFKAKSEIEYESSAFLIIEGKLFTASITAASNVNFDTTLMAILESFQLQESITNDEG